MCFDRFAYEAVKKDDDPRELYCTACFTGKYPVKLEGEQEAALAATGAVVTNGAC